ncbi:putative cross-wall-targeting lipoprotein signal domain-containing proteiin [Streptococcus dentiloxodontae]
MLKNELTFSKRKHKAAGLCGTILATAVIAVGTRTAAHADETDQTGNAVTAQETVTVNTEDQTATDQVLSETTVSNTADTTVETETSATPEESYYSPTSDEVENSNTSIEESTADQTAFASEETVNSQTDSTNTSDNGAGSPASSTATSTSDSANQAANNVQEANNVTAPQSSAGETTEVNRVNFNDIIGSYKKSANVANVTYNGTADETIMIDPSQPYTPNTENIANYLNQYLTELRTLNGINIPVPSVDQVMQQFAQARAQEEANESDGLDHATTLNFPSGVSWYGEDGQYDSQATIGTGAVGSDQATAYYLALSWFSDYFNISQSDTDGLVNFGHTISILSTSGVGMGFGYANGTGSQADRWYGQLIFGSVGSGENKDGFSAIKNGDGQWVLYYNGTPVKFLPNTTFHYVTANNNAANTTQDPQITNPSDNGNTQPATPAAPISNGPQVAATDQATAPAEDPNSLPTTGEKQSAVLPIVGATLLIAGLGLLAAGQFKKRMK